jgi:hypothetical protein
MTSICKDCEHFHNEEPGSVREHIWYNHYCLASPLPTRIDPYDGAVRPYGINDLGTVYMAKVGFKNCRNVNPEGQCQKFSPLIFGQ